MDILPFKFSEVVSLHNRLSKLSPSSIIEEGQQEPKNTVNISSEARKRQIIEQARSEVIERIKGTG